MGEPDYADSYRYTDDTDKTDIKQDRLNCKNLLYSFYPCIRNYCYFIDKYTDDADKMDFKTGVHCKNLFYLFIRVSMLHTILLILQPMQKTVALHTLGCKLNFGFRAS